MRLIQCVPLQWRAYSVAPNQFSALFHGAMLRTACARCTHPLDDE